MKQPTVVKAIMKTVNLQSRNFLSSKTAPKNLYVVKRLTKENKRQILLTPLFRNALNFMTESVTV